MGEKHPDYLLPGLTSSQFVDWMAYAEIEPFGEVRGDIQAGVVASTIANVYRDAKQKKTPFSVLDFMPFQKREEKKESLGEKIRNTMRAMKDGK